MNEVMRGVGVGNGAVVGPVARVNPPPRLATVEPPAADLEAAKEDIRDAFARVAQRLRIRSAKTTGTLSEVLAATAQMAADPALLAEISARVDTGLGAVTAVDQVIESFSEMLAEGGEYLAERVLDLKSVRDRVIAELLGLPEPGVPALSEPSVIVADDLAPADAATLDLRNVLAIVTRAGGPTSHTAIIAGQLGIPCVVRVADSGRLQNGQVVAVDAARGTIVLDPDDAERNRILERTAVLAQLAADTAPGATADGVRVELLANIGTVADARRAAETAVEGVGLFRTEVLFLDRATRPSVAEQVETYATVLAAMGDRKVIVRTLDAGADKPLVFANQPDEENPALGVRGYRLNRILPDLVYEQIAALAQASKQAGKEPWVMAPMVATREEAAEFAGMCHDVGLRTVGVMVEIPAAAIRSLQILDEVDFVSLGTNDLAQYTMGTDRLRGELNDLLSMWQPAVLELVAKTAWSGLETRKPVGVCGESASDPLMALVLTGFGCSSLSMAPKLVPMVRFVLRNHTLKQCRRMAEAALGAPDASGARAAVLDLVEPSVRALLGDEVN